MTSPAAPGAPAPGLDEQFATMPRLKAAAFLAGCGEAEFGAVAQACELSAGTLSKAATALEAASYVRVRKGYLGRRPRTWLSLTAAGRAAFEGHLAALAALTRRGQDLGTLADAEPAGRSGER
jgi:DNA-binding MarR family transcriptional regulator